MFVEWVKEGFDGGLLYAILEKHNLLSAPMKDPNVCMMAAERMSMAFLHDGGHTPLAILLESYPEPGVIGFMLITERARLNQRRNELIEVSVGLRQRWFDEMGAYRVESRIPVERTQTIRCLKHLGFRIETLPKGLRNAALYGKTPTSLCILGLLPTDSLRELSKDTEEPTLSQEVADAVE